MLELLIHPFHESRLLMQSYQFDYVVSGHVSIHRRLIIGLCWIWAVLSTWLGWLLISFMPAVIAWVNQPPQVHGSVWSALDAARPLFGLLMLAVPLVALAHALRTHMQLLAMPTLPHQRAARRALLLLIVGGTLMGLLLGIVQVSASLAAAPSSAPLPCGCLLLLLPLGLGRQRFSRAGHSARSSGMQ